MGLPLITVGAQTCNEDWYFHPVLFEKKQLRGKSIFYSAWFGLTSIKAESSESAVLREQANMRQFTTVVEFIIHYLH